MYIWQNALKNLGRNKGRNIMIAAILFAIILTTVVTLIINNTASAVIDDYKNRFASEVSIQPDTEKLREEAGQNAEGGRFVSMRIPTLSSELYLQFTDSEYLQKSVLTGSLSANSDMIRAIDQQDESEEEEEQDTTEELPGNAMGGPMISIARGNFGGGNFSLLGDQWEDFTEGTRTLESGELPQNDGECVISTDLAEENALDVGDSITFIASIGIDVPEDADTSGWTDGGTVDIGGITYDVSIFNETMITLSREAELTLTISGIYNDLNDAYPNDFLSGMPSMNSRNEVLTTLQTLLDVRNSGESGVQVSATYYLADPDMLTDFEAEVRAKGLPDTFTVSTDASSYDSIVKPVLGLKSVSITFMLVVVVLGAIILLLLASISIRERKYEIGVLRAMGMKKSRVALGLLMEMLAITCLCLVVGLLAGTLAAQPISDALLAQQIEAAESDQDGGMFPGGMTQGGGGGGRMQGGMMRSANGATFFGGGGGNAEPLDEMEIRLGLRTVLEIIGISLALALLSCLVSVSKITKYEPIKILMERN